MSDQQERSNIGDLKLLGRIWTFARPDSWVFVYALVITPAIAAMSLVQPYLMKRIIDDYVLGTDFALSERLAGLRELCWLYFAAVLGGYLLTATYTLALSWGGQRTILRLRSRLYRHTISLAQRFFDRQPAGKLLTRITNDVESLGESLAAGVVTIALDVFMIVGILGAMFWLEWRLTLVLLVFSPVVLVILEATRRRLKKLFLVVREAIASVNAYMAERIDGVVVVQLFGDEDRANDSFAVHNQRYNRTTKQANVYDAFLYAFVDGMSSVFVGLVLFYGAGLFEPLLVSVGLDVSIDSVLSAGLMVAFIDYLDRLFRPLRELSGKVTIIQRAVAALNKIVWLLDADLVPDAGGSKPNEPFMGRLRIRNLRFRYGPEMPEVIRGVDLDVESGQVVAIVGATGSGKTTLTRILDRSYEGYEGSIELDGKELSELALADLRHRVASVRQDVQVFGDSIRFNVDLDNPRIPEQRRYEAARVVNADRFIERLGWSHVLRERGSDLSQGEGQLLTFARTMAHDPSLVILDEATASIDSMTEQLIQEAIARILSRKTVIVIAHRLSTIQHADRIIVMDGGRIIEQGTHTDLLRRNGAYAALFHAGLNSELAANSRG